MSQWESTSRLLTNRSVCHNAKFSRDQSNNLKKKLNMWPHRGVHLPHYMLISWKLRKQRTQTDVRTQNRRTCNFDHFQEFGRKFHHGTYISFFIYCHFLLSLVSLFPPRSAIRHWPPERDPVSAPGPAEDGSAGQLYWTVANRKTPELQAAMSLMLQI